MPELFFGASDPKLGHVVGKCSRTCLAKPDHSLISDDLLNASESFKSKRFLLNSTSSKNSDLLLFTLSAADPNSLDLLLAHHLV